MSDWKSRSTVVSGSGNSNVPVSDWKSRSALVAPPDPKMGGKPPIGAVIGLASDLAPWNKVNQAWKRGVENFSEFAGKNTNLDTTDIAASLMPVAMAPELLGAVTGFRGTKMAGNPTVRGLMNTPKELGSEYAAQDIAAGIRKVPVETSSKAVFEDPYKYPSQLAKARPKPTLSAEPLPTTIPEKIPENFAGFHKFAEGRINKFGDQLSPQELQNYKVHLETQMANGTIPKYKTDGEGTTQIYQQASALRDKIAKVFKKTMDSRLKNADLPKNVLRSRTALDKANTISNTLSRVPRKIGKGILGLGAVGGTYAVGKKLWDALGK